VAVHRFGGFAAYTGDTPPATFARLQDMPTTNAPHMPSPPKAAGGPQLAAPLGHAFLPAVIGAMIARTADLIGDPVADITTTAVVGGTALVLYQLHAVPLRWIKLLAFSGLAALALATAGALEPFVNTLLPMAAALALAGLALRYCGFSTSHTGAGFWLSTGLLLVFGACLYLIARDDLELYPLESVLIFGSLISALIFGHVVLNLSVTAAFWAAIAVICPFSAAAVALLTKPAIVGGLGINPYGLVAFLVVALGFQLYLARRAAKTRPSTSAGQGRA